MPPTLPRVCRNDGCDVQVILAHRDGRWVALEAKARTGLDQAACLVLVGSSAWRLLDLIEHFMTTYEMSEPKARARALEHPFHRVHRCEPTTQTPEVTHG